MDLSNSTNLIFLLVATIVSLSILYFIIKGAVKSAILEVEYKKSDFLKAEKVILNKLLQEGNITQQEYDTRSIILPIGLTDKTK